MSPIPRTAEPSLTTATEFPRVVSRCAADGSSAIARQSSATPGVKTRDSAAASSILTAGFTTILE
jgi:hypothetical protein